MNHEKIWKEIRKWKILINVIETTAQNNKISKLKPQVERDVTNTLLKEDAETMI